MIIPYMPTVYFKLIHYCLKKIENYVTSMFIFKSDYIEILSPEV
jgi:hypothetical protein